jgi:hypothetical protein
VRLPLSPRPASSHRSLALFGSGRLTPATAEMASLLGREIVAAGYRLVTDGRSSAAVAAAAGALERCRTDGLDPRAAVLSVHYTKALPLFTFGDALAVDRSEIKRRCAMVQVTTGAFVVGGDKRTREDVMMATLEAIVEGYSLLPVPGTGGLADRIYRADPSLEDPAMTSSQPTPEKARKLVARLLDSPCWLCDVDPMVMHDRWFKQSPVDAESRTMFHVRHRYF